MATLYDEVKRTTMPYKYYVNGTVEYMEFKSHMIEKTKKLVRR